MHVCGFADGSANFTVAAAWTETCPDFELTPRWYAGSSALGFWQTTDHCTFTACAGTGTTLAEIVLGATAVPCAYQTLVPFNRTAWPITLAVAAAPAAPTRASTSAIDSCAVLGDIDESLARLTCYNRAASWVTPLLRQASGLRSCSPWQRSPSAAAARVPTRCTRSSAPRRRRSRCRR